MNEQPAKNRKLKSAYRGTRAFMAKTPVTLLVWHLFVISIGLIFLVVGLVMLVVPGPGALFVVLGIFVLSTEYTWAKRAMGPIKTIIETAGGWWQDPTLRKIRRQVVGSFLLIIFALGGWYLYRYGMTLDGFRDLEELLTR
ncbi:MAG: PGPGW domain-containing protein [Candidatus Nanopelagicales bacterium]